MTLRRAAIVAGWAVAVAAAAAWMRPLRFVVDGLSMAPGLMPADVVTTGWLPAADTLRTPRRFDRWIVTTADDERALKRVVALPGEAVAIHDGDLVVGGATVLKPPSILGEVAVAAAATIVADDRQAVVSAAEVLDDVAFVREVNRPLEVVRDTGLTAVVRTGATATRATFAGGGANACWLLPAHARCRIVGGRLDGHVVAVAWREPEASVATLSPRVLPRRLPAAWSMAVPECDLAPNAAGVHWRIEVDQAARLTDVAAWRDVHWRPVADDGATWRLGHGSFLMLGDFPTASIDSRAWGPLPRRALVHRVHPVP
ncbi:MAG: S26 family signal peptidase [Planctomycetaceae bacterium]